MVEINQFSVIWIELFVMKVREEIVPFDSERISRDILYELNQTTSDDEYLNRFRNNILTIAEMTDGEKRDRFRMDFKLKVRLKVMNSEKNTFEEA